MNRRASTLIVSSLATALAACSAQVEDGSDPDYVPLEGVDDDTAQAMLVVDGTIEDVQSFESDEVGMYTLARVRVDTAVSGQASEGQVLVVQVRGGLIGEDLVLVSHQPVLEADQRARFYLDPLMSIDQQAIDADQDAVAWAGGDVLGIRNGTRGRVALTRAPEGGIGVIAQALEHGGTAEGFSFPYDIPYSLEGRSYEYWVNPNTADTAGEELAVQMGFKAWEAERGSRVSFAYKGTTTSTRMRRNDINLVQWKSGYLESWKVAETSVYAKYYSRTGETEVVGFDLVFNDDKQWGLYSDTLIEHTAMHEAGHALGFTHVSDTDQIMYGSYQPTLRLGLGDRAGVREWYRGPETALIGDLNGDNKDDIITLQNFNGNGDIWVALQGSNSFGTASIWLPGGAVPGTVPLTGRFNNDSRDDLALLFPTPTNFAVAVCTSTGSSFSNCAWWRTDFPDSVTYRAGDVNGDGLDDLVGFVQGVTGEVYVALSNGSSFGTPQVWYPFWFGLGDSTPELADVDGDNDDDLVLFQQGANGTNQVYVARSNRSSFDGAIVAADSFCYSDDQPLVGDIDNDNRDDIACIFGDTMAWMRGQPDGTFVAAQTSLAYVPWRNRTTYIGRFPTVGSVVNFSHCEAADVWVYPRNASTGRWDAPSIWHDYFAPGPEPCR